MKLQNQRYLVVFLSLLGFTTQASAESITPDCSQLVSDFLTAPNNSKLTAMQSREETGCWSVVGSSNMNLQRLQRAVKNGNPAAGKYLAVNLKHLDGGNLEDSLIALGQFSETRATSFLSFAEKGYITNQELEDAVTMLPLSLSDDENAQLAAMETRAKKIGEVTCDELKNQRALALDEIRKFMSEIRVAKSHKD